MDFLQRWLEQEHDENDQVAKVAKRLYVLAYLLLFLAFLQFLFALSRRDSALVMMFVALWFVMATTNFVLAELYRERYQRLSHESGSEAKDPAASNDSAPVAPAAPAGPAVTVESAGRSHEGNAAPASHAS